MRAAVRSVRNLGPTFPHQRNNYSSAFVRRTSPLIGSNSSSVYRSFQNAEIHRFFFSAIFMSRAFSTDAAAKVNNTGSIQFHSFYLFLIK